MRRWFTRPSLWLSLAAPHCAPLERLPRHPVAGGGARRRVASLGMDPASPFIALQSPGAPARPGRTESVALEPSPSSPVARPDRLSRAGAREIAAAAFVEGRIAGGQMRKRRVYFRQPPADVKALLLLLLRVGVRPHSIGVDARFVEIACGIRG